MSRLVFSVEVGGDREGDSAVKGLTDPGLVKQLARSLHVDVRQVAVQASVQPVREVLLSLDWKYPARGRDYLDGSCLVYSEDTLLDIVDYRGAASCSTCHGTDRGAGLAYPNGWSAGKGEGAAILHSGDVMSSDGGSHVIRLRVDDLPPHATDCFFALSAYSCGDLSKFKAPSMRLFNADCPTHLLSTYTVEKAGAAAGVVVCSLAREGRAWAVRAFGHTFGGTVRHYEPFKAAIAPLQEPHVRWRRRRPYVLLAALWNADRALSRAGIGQDLADRASESAMELQTPLFRMIVKFL